MPTPTPIDLETIRRTRISPCGRKPTPPARIAEMRRIIAVEAIATCRGVARRFGIGKEFARAIIRDEVDEYWAWCRVKNTYPITRREHRSQFYA